MHGLHKVFLLAAISYMHVVGLAGSCWYAGQASIAGPRMAVPTIGSPSDETGDVRIGCAAG